MCWYAGFRLAISLLYRAVGGSRSSSGSEWFSTLSAVTCWLALRVQCVDVHREVEFVAYDLLVLACEFVGTVDALGVPVCPVQTVLKHSDSKRVWEACNKHPIHTYDQVQQDSD